MCISVQLGLFVQLCCILLLIWSCRLYRYFSKNRQRYYWMSALWCVINHCTPTKNVNSHCFFFFSNACITFISAWTSPGFRLLWGVNIQSGLMQGLSGTQCPARFRPSFEFWVRTWRDGEWPYHLFVLSVELLVFEAPNCVHCWKLCVAQCCWQLIFFFFFDDMGHLVITVGSVLLPSGKWHHDMTSLYRPMLCQACQADSQ